MDEPFSIYHSQQTLQEILVFFNTAHENNPPLYFILLHFWMQLFGDGAVSVRILSVLFGSLTTVIIFFIGKKFFSLFSGLMASLIFTFSTLHIYYSHEARVYSFFVLLTTLSLFYYLQIVSKPERKKNYFFLFLTNLILIYSHYFGFFVILAECISFFILSAKKRIWKGFSLVLVGLILCYLPHFAVMLERFAFTTSSGTWVAPPAVTEYYGNLNRFLNHKYCTAILVLLFAVSVILLIKNKQLKSSCRKIFSDTNLHIIFLWFFVPYTLMFFISFKMPMFIDRYIIFTSIPFYLFLAAVLHLMLPKQILNYLFGTVLIFALVFTVQLNPDNKRRLKDATDAVKDLKRENTIVVIAPEYADLGFTYHYNIDYFRDYKNMRNLLASDNIFPVNSADMTKNILRSHSGDCVFFQADTQFSDPENLIFKTLANKYSKHSEKKVFEIYTIHYFSN